MKLILVRHGETEDIVAGVHQRFDTRLSPLGREQARKVAERFKGEHIDHIYASDFPRVLETLEAIRKYHPSVPVTIDKRIREIDLGDLMGTPRDTFRKLVEKSKSEWCGFVPPGGESVRAVRDRFIPFLEEVSRKHEGTVLVVCHGYPIMWAILHVLGQGEDKMMNYNPKNTAVTIFDFPEKKIELLNCTKHLD